MVSRYPPGASYTFPSPFWRGPLSPLFVAPIPSGAAAPVDPVAGAAPEPGGGNSTTLQWTRPVGTVVLAALTLGGLSRGDEPTA